MAISRNILLYQGANGVIQSAVSDANNAGVDLTNYNISAKAKKHHDSANSIIMTCNGYSNGIIVCTINSETTSSMDAGRYVYDIDITDTLTNNTIRIQHGLLVLKPNV